jgi:hypothetical protein
MLQLVMEQELALTPVDAMKFVIELLAIKQVESIAEIK